MTNTVYVVECSWSYLYDFETGTEFIKIYSTLEKAIEAVDDFIPEEVKQGDCKVSTESYLRVIDNIEPYLYIRSIDTKDEDGNDSYNYYLTIRECEVIN